MFVTIIGMVITMMVVVFKEVNVGKVERGNRLDIVRMIGIVMMFAGFIINAFLGI